VQPEQFKADGKKTTYHAPCHLCRGLGVTKAPRELMAIGGLNYLPADEEDVCCGFGGTYSMKFPELSAELLKKKLANSEKTGAELLLTDCPGCIMQLRGGLEAKGSTLQVRHIAEALADRLK
jgi:Fe-S oxidoreductase